MGIKVGADQNSLAVSFNKIKIIECVCAVV